MDPGCMLIIIYIMNIGLPARQEEIMKYGMGFILAPKTFDANSTLANLGQRQAILHDISTSLGIFIDSGNACPYTAGKAGSG